MCACAIRNYGSKRNFGLVKPVECNLTPTESPTECISTPTECDLTPLQFMVQKWGVNQHPIFNRVPHHVLCFVTNVLRKVKSYLSILFTYNYIKHNRLTVIQLKDMSVAVCGSGTLPVYKIQQSTRYTILLNCMSTDLEVSPVDAIIGSVKSELITVGKTVQFSTGTHEVCFKQQNFTLVHVSH